MKQFLLLSFLYLLNSQAIQEDQGVLIMTAENFDSIIEKYEYVFVDFFMSWCGPCNDLAPKWAQAARTVRSSLIQFGKVDCQQQSSICSQQQITGYPTMKLFSAGSAIEYNGGRMPNEIVDFIKKKTDIGSQEITSLNTLMETTMSNQVLLVYFGQNKQQREFQSFSNYAKAYPDSAKYMHTFDSSISNHYNVDPRFSMILFKQFDERKVVYDGDYTPYSIKDFVERNSFPTILELDFKTANYIFGTFKNTLFLFSAQNQLSLKAEKQIRLASSSIRDRVKICLVNVNDSTGKKLASYLRLNMDQLPIITLVLPNEDNYTQFIFEEEKTSQNLIDFVRKHIPKVTETKNKSQIPIEQDL